MPAAQLRAETVFNPARRRSYGRFPQRQHHRPRQGHRSRPGGAWAGDHRRMYERMFQNRTSATSSTSPTTVRPARSPRRWRRRPRLCAEHRQSRRARRPSSASRRSMWASTSCPNTTRIVAEALLGAIKDVLGEAATDEIWPPGARRTGSWPSADRREKAIYRDLAAAPGGWNGWRNFRSRARRQRARSSPPSCCGPRMAGPSCAISPGQYLTFWLDVPGAASAQAQLQHLQCARTTDLPHLGQAEPEPKGIASNWLHDQVEVGTVLKVAPPAGEFFLNEESPRPVVLLSGGVGLTPMMSMLETIAARYPDTADPVRAWHAERLDPCHEGPRPVAGRRIPNIKVRTILRRAAGGGPPGRGLRPAGLITVGMAAGQHAAGRGGYYLCGPRPFLRALRERTGAGGRSVEPHPLRVLRTADEILAA